MNDSQPTQEELNEFKRIQELIKTLEEKAKEDISYLLENKRHEEETNEIYTIRKKLRDQFTKQQKKGYMFHRSKYIVQLNPEEETEKPVYQMKTSTYRNADKKSKFRKITTTTNTNTKANTNTNEQ